MGAGESATKKFGPSADVLFPQAKGPALMVCEHASNAVPEALNRLGLGRDVLDSHAAWDPGALGLAREMARRLDAALVAARFSRLVYDCNRPPEAPGAVLAKSEVYDIPGNANLSAAARAARVDHVYRPFRDRLTHEIATRAPQALVTVHSFTPVYCGQRRSVEIGILHGQDDRLAMETIAAARGQTDHILRLNEPYGPEDGVAHTLDVHGAANGIPSVMIEVRNDLIADGDAQTRMATLLSPWVGSAIARLASEAAR